MRKAILSLGLVAAAVAGVLACSGSSPAIGGPSACLQGAAGSSCYACIQDNCGSSLSTFENACTPFVDCMCSSGSYDGCNAQACASQISPACSSATSGLGSCSACTSQCSGFTLDSCTGGGGSGGGGSSGVGSSSGGSSCLAAASGSACWSCLQGACGPELGAFETDCTAYVDCVCPGGSFDACSASACASQVTTTCDSSTQALGSCETQSCGGSCTGTTSSGGGGSSSGGACSSSSGSGSSSGGTGTTCSGSSTCPSSGAALEFCIVGSETSCYYEVGGQMFPCTSCSDVTSCAQSAAAVCQ